MCFRQCYKSFISVATLKTQFYMLDLAGSSCSTLCCPNRIVSLISCLFDFFFFSPTVLIIVQSCIDLITLAINGGEKLSHCFFLSPSSSFITFVCQKTSVKTTSSSWTAPCPPELLRSWRSEFCW